eukprot:PhF_6_TR8462/c0_g1_i2/m.13218
MFCSVILIFVVGMIPEQTGGEPSNSTTFCIPSLLNSTSDGSVTFSSPSSNTPLNLANISITKLTTNWSSALPAASHKSSCVIPVTIEDPDNPPVRRNPWVCMIPESYGKIVCVDAVTKFVTWEYGMPWFSTSPAFSASVVVSETHFHLVPSGASIYYAICRIDTLSCDTQESEIVMGKSPLNYAVPLFVSGIFDGTDVWWVPGTFDRLVKYRASNVSLSNQYSMWPAGFTKTSTSFSGGVYDGAYIWLIPKD